MVPSWWPIYDIFQWVWIMLGVTEALFIYLLLTPYEKEVECESR